MDLVSGSFFDHFINPRNTGLLKNPDGAGKYGDPVCGDFLIVTIRVSEERIDDIRFLCRGCSAAIATSSAMTDLAKGKRLDEALGITPRMIEDEVGGLSDEKRHCSVLGAEALRAAIEDYRRECEREDRGE